MRIYPEDAMETLRARTFLAEAKADGLVTAAQYERLEQETVSELSTINLFLRIVLFFFTILCVLAAAGLCFVLFKPTHPAESVLLLIFGALCYGGAEFMVRESRFYHHGIEEALAVSSIGYVCAGLETQFGRSLTHPHDAVSLISAAGAVFSLWIWQRFGLWYVFLIGMLFVAFLPSGWTSSPSRHHVIVGAIYAAGLLGLALVRRRHRFEVLDQTYALAEAFLWLGIYLCVNLKILAMGNAVDWFGGMQAPLPFGRPFYWTTWMLIWCLPPVILARGVRLKDRFVVAAGGVAALLTLVVNKPYLGWERHTWDPMLLGIVLTGGALLLQRWLDQGASGVRHGFTAARLSKKDGGWMNVGASALGFFSPHSLVPEPQASNPDLGLDGGVSGGGGASRDF